jgi:hypothetical protein
MVLSVLALAVSRLLAMDHVMGVSLGREETLSCIETLIGHIEVGSSPEAVATSSIQGPS